MKRISIVGLSVLVALIGSGFAAPAVARSAVEAKSSPSHESDYATSPETSASAPRISASELAISDAQLADCLLKIAELPPGAVDGVSPSDTFDEYARLKPVLYYSYPDVVGFGVLENGQAVMEGSVSTRFRVPVPARNIDEAGALDATLTTALGLKAVDVVVVPGSATVRDVCAVFLDVMSYRPVADLATTVMIDQSTNQVVVATRDGKGANLIAERYGDLARTRAGGDTVEEAGLF